MATRNNKLAKVTVNSFNCEFGYELISVIPYAYYLFSKGRLKGTISGRGSEPFYYFSPHHTINPAERSWSNHKFMNTPNRHIHRPKLNTKEFKPPPYKQIYANKKYHFDLVIYNRFNNEWPGIGELNKPLNYFDDKLLDHIFTKFKGKILYCNVDGEPSLYDDAPPKKGLNDYEVCMAHKNVTIIHDLEEDYNTAQLMAFANCPLFLTMNGGGCILASYFGGKNVIYTNPQQARGRTFPRENETGDFSYYYLFGGSSIVNVHSYDAIKKLIL